MLPWKLDFQMTQAQKEDWAQQETSQDVCLGTCASLPCCQLAMVDDEEGGG